MVPGDWREGVWSGNEKMKGGPHLLILLVEVGEGAWNEASVIVSLNSSSDGESLS